MESQFRLRSLGSGSTGNATLLERTGADGLPQRLLVDAGFSSVKKLETRLHELCGVRGEGIHAIFITHEHSDHIGCALKWVEKFGTQIFMSQGTHRALGLPDLGGRLHLLRDGDTAELGGRLALEPFTVPHDACEPLQLRLSDGEAALGILTDLGHISAHVRHMLAPCNALLLEYNHEPELLEAGPYPPFLKRRVAGPLGHLNNGQAHALAQELFAAGRLQWVVAAHLSERNNRPDLVQALFAQIQAQQPELSAEQFGIACPKAGTEWMDCSPHVFA